LQRFPFTMHDFDLLCAIGSGTCGEVSKMKHKPTGRVLAVKVSSRNMLLEYIFDCVPICILINF
jgi:hypothetical protein